MTNIELNELEEKIPYLGNEQLVKFIEANWRISDRLFGVAINDALIRNVNISKIVADIENESGTSTKVKTILIEGILENLNKYEQDHGYQSLIFIGGIVLTIITFIAAISGGIYVVAWGAILFGGIKMFSLKTKISTLKSYLKVLNHQELVID